ILIRKHWGNIRLTPVELIGDSPVAVSRYIIYEVTSTGWLEAIHEVSHTQLQIGGTSVYSHRYLKKDRPYSYVARAFDASGNIIGESNEETI
ncbi:MAG: hypothetical protein GY940_35435, partial [bacterium]|nr:hypothetical protein [bacterium]